MADKEAEEAAQTLSGLTGMPEGARNAVAQVFAVLDTLLREPDGGTASLTQLLDILYPCRSLAANQVMTSVSTLAWSAPANLKPVLRALRDAMQTQQKQKKKNCSLGEVLEMFLRRLVLLVECTCKGNPKPPRRGDDDDDGSGGGGGGKGKGKKRSREQSRGAELLNSYVEKHEALQTGNTAGAGGSGTVAKALCTLLFLPESALLAALLKHDEEDDTAASAPSATCRAFTEPSHLAERREETALHRGTAAVPTMRARRATAQPIETHDISGASRVPPAHKVLTDSAQQEKLPAAPKAMILNSTPQDEPTSSGDGTAGGGTSSSGFVEPVVQPAGQQYVRQQYAS